MINRDPARTILGPYATPDQVLQLREKLGLNESLPVQVGRYLQRIAALDFGSSYVDDRSVRREVFGRLKITLLLVFFSLLWMALYLLCMIHVFRRPLLRRISGVIELLFRILPIFFSGVIVGFLVVRYSPVTNFSGQMNAADLYYLLPPAAVLALYPMAVLSAVLKQSLAATYQAPFITSARAFGHSEITILYRYALRNAAVPFLASLSNILPAMFTSAFIVEIVFSVPGIGTLLVRSIMDQDLPMIEGTIIVNALFFIIVNFIIENSYWVIDPQLRGGRKQ